MNQVPTTMTAAVYRSFGTAEEIQIETMPVPKPKKKQVLVKVERSSLNALDWHFLTGTPYMIRMMAGFGKPRRPILGADVAGVVVAVGSGATDFEVGDAVFGESNGGACAQYVAVATKRIAKIPKGVSFDAAGASPIAGITALQGLLKVKVQPGDDVLINGASGGVGTFAVQIAKAMGANVTAVCSTGKVDMVSRLGADEVIDYTQQDFVDGGARFDVMLDSILSRPIDETLSVLRPNARYLAISGPKDNLWFGPVGKQMRTGFALARRSQSFASVTAMANREDLTHLGELLANESVVPEIDRVVGLDGVVAGMAEIGAGHARAKIVVAP